MANNSGKETDLLEVSFDATFPQSDEFDGIRSNHNIIYSHSRKRFFNLLSVLIGTILAVAWGLLFAAL